MFLFVSLLFTNLISKGIISIIYKFNLFFIARKISIHFTTRRNPQIILLRIIRVVPETCNYLTSMSVFFYFNFTPSSFISFTLYIFKQFIYFDFIITTYSIYSVNSVYSTVIPFNHLLYIF